METRESVITTVKTTNQNVAALAHTGVLVNVLHMRTFNEINNRLPKPLKLKSSRSEMSLRDLNQISIERDISDTF